MKNLQFLFPFIVYSPWKNLPCVKIVLPLFILQLSSSYFYSSYTNKNSSIKDPYIRVSGDVSTKRHIAHKEGSKGRAGDVAMACHSSSSNLQCRICIREGKNGMQNHYSIKIWSCETYVSHEIYHHPNTPFKTIAVQYIKGWLWNRIIVLSLGLGLCAPKTHKNFNTKLKI